ncbi:MAG: hypothetical protein HUU45_00950 [Leptospiraceae bacterium]|nr:hypothetical protein [Leptospiraceae bacterium]
MNKILFILVISFSLFQFNCSTTEEVQQPQQQVTPPPPPPEKTPEELKAAAKTLRTALKKGNSEYFTNVKFDELEPALAYTDSKGKKVIPKFGFRGISILISAFKNQDAQVRKAIYLELGFSDLPAIEGGTIADSMEKDEESKLQLEILRNSLILQAESDPIAQGEFQELLKKYFVSSSPQKTYKSILKIVNDSNANPETAKFLLQQLEFTDAGGPVAVFPEFKKRKAKSKKFAKLAEIVQNSEIKESLEKL